MVTIKRVQSQEWKNFEIALKGLQRKVGKVGWFKGSKYDDENQTSVAQVAVSNEFGNPSRNVPARPFMRPTISKKENEWKKIAEDGSKQLIKGNVTVYDLMEIIGQKATGDIKKTISEIWTPALKESTIKSRIRKYTSSPDLSIKTRNKRSKQVKKFIPSAIYKPLIDTGLMFATLINTVEDE